MVETSWAVRCVYGEGVSSQGSWQREGASLQDTGLQASVGTEPGRWRPWLMDYRHALTVGWDESGVEESA